VERGLGKLYSFNYFLLQEGRGGFKEEKVLSQ